MRHPEANTDQQQSTIQQTETPRTYPTSVDEVRSARRKRIATLLFVGATNLLGAIGASGAVGCGGKVVVDDQGTYENPGLDGGTDCDGSKCLDDGGSKPDAGPDGSMGIDGGPDGSMGIDGGGSKPGCNHVEINYGGPLNETSAKGTTNIPALCVTVLNGCVEGDLKNLTFEVEGTIDPENIEFALGDNSGARFTTFSSPGVSKTKFNFNEHLGANEGKTICTTVNIDPKAATNDTFRINMIKPLPSDNFMSNGADTSLVPDTLPGNTFTVGSATIGTVTVTDNSAPSGLTPLLSGQANGKIAAFSVASVDYETPPGPVENSDLRRVSLHLGGTCDPDHISNIQLYEEGNPSAIANVDGVNTIDLAHLKTSAPLPFIPMGGTRNFYVTANQSCPPGTYIATNLDHPSDLFSASQPYGFGEQVHGYDGEGSKGSASYVNIE